MDPSEFEGTIERRGEVLNAGALETFLGISQPKFTNMDLCKESDEIYMAIYNVKESLKCWEECSIGNLHNAWDEQAIKIAELKDEVITRKKALGAKIRQFSANFLAEEIPQNEDTTADIRSESKSLIDAFKSEFDFVLSASRFSESAFSTTYKLLRVVPDPIAQLEECLRICIRAQETFKAAQEQLNIAEEEIENLKHDNSMKGSGSSVNEAAITKQWSQKLEELEQRHQAELSDLRGKFDVELRSHEHNLRIMFEQKEMEHQEEFDKTIARKDSEMSSLLSSLHELNQRNIENNERQKLLESEVTKRREIEEKLRTAITDLTASQASLQELQLKYEGSVAKIERVEAQAEAIKNELMQTIGSLRVDLEVAAGKLANAEGELAARPPIDLSFLAESLGMAGEVITEWIKETAERSSEEAAHHSSSSSPSSPSPFTSTKSTAARGKNEESGMENVNKMRSFTWKSVEAFLIETIRAANHNATESRVKEKEAEHHRRKAEEECVQLRLKLKERDETVAALEQDLMSAHQAVDAGKSLLKCYTPHPITDSAKGNFDNYKSGHSIGSGGGRIVTSGSKAHYATGSLLRKVPPGGGLATADAVDACMVHDGKGGGKDGDEDEGDDDDDVERGSGGRGTAAAVLGDADASDRMFLAVQAQRDRFVKVAKEKDVEITALRNQLDRAQEEQVQLRNENLELYRRLRLLRAQARGGGTGGVGALDEDVDRRGGSSVGGGQQRQRNRRDVFTDGFMTAGSNEKHGALGDAIDRKYSRLYEEKIDPFKLEELDRQSVLAQMNVFERALAYVTRFFMQDQWARHSLLVYLFLVHLFALGYVVQVLNPQLIEEVDMHMKAKWEAQTLDYDMNREHPDVRR